MSNIDIVIVLCQSPDYHTLKCVIYLNMDKGQGLDCSINGLKTP